METVSLAKLQRDGFELVVTDPGDQKLQAGNFLTTDGRQMKLSEATDDDLFELADGTDDNSDQIKLLRLKKRDPRQPDGRTLCGNNSAYPESNQPCC